MRHDEDNRFSGKCPMCGQPHCVEVVVRVMDFINAVVDNKEGPGMIELLVKYRDALKRLQEQIE